MSLNEDISAAIRPIIEATGNYLEELTITSAGKVKILTVIVDSDSEGIAKQLIQQVVVGSCVVITTSQILFSRVGRNILGHQ